MPDLTVVPVVLPAVRVAELRTLFGIVQTTARYGSPPDLLALYATLLI